MELRCDRAGEREVEVRLEDAHTLRVRVVDDAGRPIEGASVWMEPGTTETDADGRFIFRGLSEKPIPLRIEHAYHNNVAATLAPADGEHRIVVK